MLHLTHSFLFLILFVPFSSGQSSEGFDPSCQSHYTQGYGYRLFFDLPRPAFLPDNKMEFNFSLSGPSDGHILLSERPNTYPGYEMVLGAGANEFSELRKYVSSKFEVKATRITKRILSVDQIRNFSITINDGEISLIWYKNESRTTVLAWRDPAPLDVRYISFCAWTGVSLVWFYECKGMKAIDEPLSPYRKLKKSVLKGYDPYSIPLEPNSTLFINASVALHHIDLDVTKSVLTSHTTFNLSWYDYKIKWNPEEFDNISSLNLLHREIWLPEIIVTNSVDEGSSSFGKGVIRLSSRGAVSWSPSVATLTWCSLDLMEWPFDRHLCSLSLGLPSHPQAVVLALSSDVQPDLTLKNSEWVLKSLTGESSVIFATWESNLTQTPSPEDSPPTILLHLELERQSSFYIYSYFIPVIGSILIIFSSFWLPVISSKRLFLHCICFFLLVVNVLSLDFALPVLVSSTPRIMSVSCSLLLLTTLHLGFCAFYLAAYKQTPRLPSSKLVTKIVTNPNIQSLFCLFGNYQTIEDEDMLPDDLKTDLRHNILFGFILDRLMFGFSILYICIVLVV